MDPQAPTLIPEKPNFPEPPKPRDNHWITIASMAAFVLLALASVAFLYYQNQQLKSMLATYQTQTSPTPIATADPTGNWKTYTSTEYGFGFKYPSNYTIDENVRTSLIQVIVNKSEKDSFNIGVSSDYKPANVKFFLDTEATGERKINDTVWQEYSLPQGYGDGGESLSSPVFGLQTEKDKLLYTITFYGETKTSEIQNQILSTFKFLETGPSPTTRACTMEAKLCSDGSYVGRTGPNCEFAPCP